MTLPACRWGLYLIGYINISNRLTPYIIHLLYSIIVRLKKNYKRNEMQKNIWIQQN